jgi:ATP citrate (pro-S)-lyase
VAELFETPPQFGHAKAMATRSDESAGAKAKALRAAGAHVANDYGGFVSQIESLSDPNLDSPTTGSDGLIGRSSALFASSISGDEGDVVRVLDQDLLVFAESNAFARIAVSMFLGHEIKSIELEEFVDFVLRLLVDHGPYVSGAVNTMIAARAGKDLVASLASGLLTIGPRFGGAINEAASTWLAGATGDNSPQGMVDEFAERREKIAGIGHRKYSADIPDPRVIRLLKFADKLEAKRFTSFARSVEAITVRKKSNLILNVDGAIAAILLDILSEKEGYSDADLRELVSTEFFNGLFVLSRSVGFMAHYFDQRRLDEGLFRLSPSEVALLKPTVNQSDHTTKP